jgi:putative ABC transport system ATP-binding protein
MATATIPISEPLEAHAYPVPAAETTRICTNGLRVARGGRTIDIPDFSVRPGQTIALVGPSGSGKTTALMAMSLMHRPVSGTILIEGNDPWRLSLRARDQFRGRHIGLIFQSFHLVDALDVRSNIALAARCIGQNVDTVRLVQLLAQLGLAEIVAQRADRISHGQAQRVAVARALFNQPSIILADEPTSALDDRNANNLLSLLKTSAEAARAALVITSHDRRVLDQVDTIVNLRGAT